MKKKILSVILLICVLLPCMFFATACKDKEDKSLTTNFCLLQKGQTLNIGSSIKLKNNKDSITEKYYIRYPVSANVVLQRSMYNNGSNYVQHEGYYYFWQTSTTYDNFLVGNKTVETSTIYSYLIYGTDDSNIVVKSSTSVETGYDFSAKQIELPCEINYNLNGFFSSIENLKETVPVLYDKLTVTESNKYYIENPRTSYSYTENTYKDTYFYFT